MRRILAIAVVALLAAVGSAGCSSSGGGSYEIVAHFSRAVAVYEQSDVRVMGVAVGQVSDIEIAGDEIVVTLAIDEEVPLPADATVGIAPTSLIGERDVVLPPWKPGDERLEPGAVIGVDRTIIPVEPDEALQAVTDLVAALDPEAVNARAHADQARKIAGAGGREAILGSPQWNFTKVGKS